MGLLNQQHNGRFVGFSRSNDYAYKPEKNGLEKNGKKSGDSNNLFRNVAIVGGALVLLSINYVDPRIIIIRSQVTFKKNMALTALMQPEAFINNMPDSKVKIGRSFH